MITSTQAMSEEVQITPDNVFYTIDTNGNEITIARSEGTGKKIAPGITRTSRMSPTDLSYAVSSLDAVSVLGTQKVKKGLASQVTTGSSQLTSGRM